MARPLRIEFSGALYHVTSRGDRREPIFEDNEDRVLFLGTLAEGVERFNWVCHAYCLMTNHYHLVVETPDGNLSKGMRHLNGVYTQASNRRHARVGHLFQGRFKAILVDKDSHLLELARYVVLNPVRAGMVTKPGGATGSLLPREPGARACGRICASRFILATRSSSNGCSSRHGCRGMSSASPWPSAELRCRRWRRSRSITPTATMRLLRPMRRGHAAIGRLASISACTLRRSDG